MTEAPATTKPAMNRDLLEKLTGGLGDQKTIAKICNEFGQLYSEFLPDVFHSETNLSVQVGYVGCKMGLMSDLIDDLGDDVVLAKASLRNWSPNFVLACGNSFVVTLMENLLGALPETIEEPIARPLSRIELDLAVMVIDKIANVLRSGVNAPGGFEPSIDRPLNAEDHHRTGEPNNEFGAAIKMRIALGSITTEFALIIPQKALLKTNVVFPKSKNQAGKGQKEWTDQLTQQVKRSQVTLEARIRLQSLTLGKISRLMAGDVIPFMDESDVHVDLSANGHDMYVCEFGRAGSAYMVRVKDNVSSDDEILRHLMG